MKDFFRGQALHALALFALIAAANALAPNGDLWFQSALWIAVVHQIFVWVGWRGQTQWRLFTKMFGKADFTVWNVIFFPLLTARPVLIGVVAARDWGRDGGTLAMEPALSNALGVVLLIPAAYTGWSIHRYFGFARAAGADHFREEYRAMPMIRRGAFAWTSNAMYVFGFGALWSIALFARSHDAFVAVLFQHAYIWVHYATVERPDMDKLLNNI